MFNIEKTIEKHNLIKVGDKIGVACSGGRDSMALLVALNELKEKFNFELIVINVNHNIRENSKQDSDFVQKFCFMQRIKCLSFNVNAKKYSEDKKLSIEQAARDCRYQVFKNCIKNGTVNKIALGHHSLDQAETILLNIFRGTGLTGASGMEYIRENTYIRPLLDTTRSEIMAYVLEKEIPYVDDESNFSNDYARNYIRNMILPMIRNRWPNADQNICNFGRICKEDNQFINSKIIQNSYTTDNGIAKINISVFSQPNSIVARVIMNALKSIGASTNIEKKHIKMIKAMVKEAQNGTKINLPNSVTVIKEYTHVTLTNKNYTPSNKSIPLEKGSVEFPNFGIIESIMTRKISLDSYTHIIDYNKLPKGAEWRYRREKDIFEKFGGGTKTLKEYFIDKKIPARLRNFIPVLAKGNEIYVIAGIEISEKVRIDENSKTAWGFNVIKF